MMITTLNQHNQIKLPTEITDKLGWQAGKELLILCKADQIVLLPKPANFVETLAGFHQEIWQTIEVSEYIQQERNRAKKPLPELVEGNFNS